MKEFDSVQVKWEGSSSTAVKGIIVISKNAIDDKELIEWIENRDLYELWEQRQKPAKKATKPKTKLQPKSSGKAKTKNPLVTPDD